VGKEVNGFEIVKLIGQGKFSYVFKAQRKTDGLCVALKLIKVRYLCILFGYRFLTWITRNKEIIASKRCNFIR